MQTSTKSSPSESWRGKAVQNIHILSIESHRASKRHRPTSSAQPSERPTDKDDKDHSQYGPSQFTGAIVPFSISDDNKTPSSPINGFKAFKKKESILAPSDLEHPGSSVLLDPYVEPTVIRSDGGIPSVEHNKKESKKKKDDLVEAAEQLIISDSEEDKNVSRRAPRAKRERSDGGKRA